MRHDWDARWEARRERQARDARVTHESGQWVLGVLVACACAWLIVALVVA